MTIKMKKMKKLLWWAYGGVLGTIGVVALWCPGMKNVPIVPPKVEAHIALVESNPSEIVMSDGYFFPSSHTFKIAIPDPFPQKNIVLEKTETIRVFSSKNKEQLMAKLNFFKDVCEYNVLDTALFSHIHYLDHQAMSQVKRGEKLENLVSGEPLNGMVAPGNETFNGTVILHHDNGLLYSVPSEIIETEKSLSSSDLDTTIVRILGRMPEDVQ